MVLLTLNSATVTHHLGPVRVKEPTVRLRQYKQYSISQGGRERWMNSLLSCHGRSHVCSHDGAQPPSRSTPTPMNHHDMVFCGCYFWASFWQLNSLPSQTEKSLTSDNTLTLKAKFPWMMQRTGVPNFL